MLFDSDNEWDKLVVLPMQTNRTKTLLSLVGYWRKLHPHPFLSFSVWPGFTMPFFLFVDPLDQRTRVMSCTQFVSQVLPSSGESACSQWPVVGVMLDQRKRARTCFPLTVSSP